MTAKTYQVIARPRFPRKNDLGVWFTIYANNEAQALTAARKMAKQECRHYSEEPTYTVKEIKEAAAR